MLKPFKDSHPEIAFASITRCSFQYKYIFKVFLSLTKKLTVRNGQFYYTSSPRANQLEPNRAGIDRLATTST